MKSQSTWVLMISLLFFAGCKKEKEEDNGKCESSCVGDYADDIEKCERRTYECLATCDGPDDIECTSDCEDYEFECLGDFSICTGSCSCAQETVSCSRDCSNTDVDCLQGCVDEYTDCAGEDSAYLCALNCQSPTAICKSACDSFSYDSPEFSDCRADCASEASACLSSCK